LLDRFDLEFFGVTLTTHGTSYLGLIMRLGGVYETRGDSETLLFTNPNIVDSLAREISAAVRQFGINRGNVIVEDDEGVTRHIKIMDMPEVLWEQEYETVVALIDDINPNDFANNDYLKSLVDLFDHADYIHLLRANV
jgi:hypothetical protein